MENEYGWDAGMMLEFQFDEKWDQGRHVLAFDVTPVKPDESSRDDENDRPSSVKFEIPSIRIEGPEGTTTLVHPPNYERFFTRDEPPGSAEGRREYAAEVLGKFATRAFRRQVSDDTLRRLVDVAETTYVQPGCHLH